MKNKGFIYSFFLHIVRPPFQAFALVFSSCMIAFLLYLALQIYRPLEEPTQLIPITPDKIQQWGGEPTLVETGLFITNWHEFDVEKNNFVFDGLLWFQFDPALISLETVEKFSFEKGEILKRSEPDTKLIDGRLFVEYQIRLRFTTNLDYKLFPLDDHIVYIGMVNTYVSPGDVIFKVSKESFGRSESVHIPDWKQVGYTVTSGYERQNIDDRDKRKLIRIPKVIYALDFRRIGFNLIMLILLPIFLIFFVGLFALAFDPRKSKSAILRISITTLTSLVAYRFVIQTMSPRSGYFLLSDLVFAFYLFFAFLVFIMAIAMVYLNKLPKQFVILRGISFILFHILVIVSLIYLLFYWER